MVLRLLLALAVFAVLLFHPTAAPTPAKAASNSRPATANRASDNGTVRARTTTSFTSSASGTVPLIIDGGTIACMGTIDDRRGLLLIDSGSSTTCLFPRQANAGTYTWRKVKQRCYTANGVSTVRKVADHAQIQIAGVAYRASNLPVLPAAGAPAAIGLLGCDFLTATGAVIDFAHGRMVLRQSGGAQVTVVQENNI
jgi:hypothetical protein